jgi:hypothetical protein
MLLNTPLYSIIRFDGIVVQGIGVKLTAAQAAWQLPKAVLQARTEAGALIPAVAPM